MIRIDKKDAVKFSISLLIITAGTFMMALGNMAFLNPYNIVPGGFMGFAIILNKTILPFITPGVICLILNAPLFIAAYRIRGKHFAMYSLLGTVGYSVFIDIIPFFHINMSEITDNALLAGIYGGVFMGIGYGVIIRQGASTGGSDSLATILNTVKPNKSFGMILLMIDGLVVVFSGITFSIKGGGIKYGIPPALYAFLVIFLSSRIADYIIEGKRSSRSYNIICRDPEEMAKAIIEKLHRGVTAFNATGMFTKRDKQVLVCVVLKAETATLKRIVFSVDPEAFVFSNNATEVFGEGFVKPIYKNAEGKKDKAKKIEE